MSELTRARSLKVKDSVTSNLNRTWSVNAKRSISPFASLKNTLQNMSSNIVASISSSPTRLSQTDIALTSATTSTTGTPPTLPAASANEKQAISRRQMKKKKGPTSSMSTEFIEYQVQEGDTLPRIAAKFDVTPTELCALNRLFSRTLFPQQKLKIPKKMNIKAADVRSSKGSQGTVSGGVSEVDENEINNMNGEGDDDPFTEESPPINHKEEENDPCARQYIKVEVKYVTETEGTIGGCLLITPNMFMFSPWCADAVVMEYGVDRFIVEFPINRIRSIAMYSNPSVMYFDRKSRAKVNCMISPGTPKHKGSIERSSTASPSRESDSSGIEPIPEEQAASTKPIPPAPSEAVQSAFSVPDEIIKGAVTKAKREDQSKSVEMERCYSVPNGVQQQPFSSLPSPSAVEKASFDSSMSSTWSMLDRPLSLESSKNISDISHALPAGVMLPRRHVFDTLPFYLCVTAPSRFRGTKCSTMVRDEYWFMIPQKEADDLWEFLMKSGVPNNNDPNGLGVTDDKNDVRASTFVSICKGDSTFPLPGVHHPLTDAEIRQRCILHKESMTWELINVEEISGRINVLDAEPENLPLPVMCGKSVILDEPKIRNLLLNLPADAEGNEWCLLYSTSEHGWSLKTLYRLCQKCEKPCILLILDHDDNIFGAVLSDRIKVSDHFYGRGETYVFRWSPHFQKFRWTGENRFFVKGSMDSLTIGCSSGHAAIWLDECLYRGRTQSCATFNNPPLANGKEDFLIRELEVWSFCS